MLFLGVKVVEGLGERIRELRKEKKLTQPQLACCLGVSKGVISFWENDINEPKASYIRSLSEVFEIDPAYLLGMQDDKMMRKLK